MAPLTRSSVMGRRPAGGQHEEVDEIDEQMAMDSQDESANSVNEQESFDEEGDSYQGDSPEAQQSPSQSRAQEFLQPLQETADRVSKQVEAFARALDKFNVDRQPSDQEVWEESFTLLEGYREITSKRRNETASKVLRPKPVGKNRKSLGDTDREVNNLQLEADLWTLMNYVLVCKSPQATSDAKAACESTFAELHRYSSNTELWNAFLDSDVIAQEFESILDWLQKTADSNSSNIEDVVADLTRKADRGEGIWSAGLIYTKDSIKKQKRTRAWPMPLEPETPGLEQSHRRQTDGKPLVSQMDPDAPSREGACLEVTDEYYELAAWQVCWEMLRRGWPLSKWQEWWRDRNEQWRSAVFRNCDSRRDQPEESPWLRIINLASNREFAVRCKALSDSDSVGSDFESAVYGILAGGYTATIPACKNLDDHFFVLINSLLIERYAHFLVAFESTLKTGGPLAYQPAQSSIERLSKFVKAAQVDNNLKDETKEPNKLLECAIMGQNFDDLFIEVGRAATEHIRGGTRSKAFQDQVSDQFKSEYTLRAAQDQDSVRIVAHLQLLLQALGFLDKAYETHAEDLDSNVVNYILYLEKSQQLSIIPLYASKLDADRIPQVLAPILYNVHDIHDRDTQVNLMKKYSIPYPRVVYSICSYARQNLPDSIKGLQDARYAARITETKNKIVRIRSGFIGDNVTQEELDTVAAHEWVMYMDAKHWGMAAWSVTALYKTFLLLGNLAAAKALSQHVDLAKVSLHAVSINLSLAAAIVEGNLDEEDIDMEDDNEDDVQIVKSMSHTKKRKGSKDISTHPLARESTSREALAAKSLVWAQLEQLVVALNALELWQSIADEVEHVSRTDMRQMKQAKRKLKEVMLHLHEVIPPVLEEDFLMKPNDEDEGLTLTLIRNHYLPEVVLAWNSALYFAGHSLTRQHLVECMTLAQVVAQNATLTEAFVTSKRMQELVTAFAQDSQALLRANEAGASHPKKGGRDSLTGDIQGRADIWNVEWKPDNAATD